MKNALLAILCLLLLSNCRKEEEYLFTMDYDLEFTIQPGLSPFGGIYGFVMEDVPSRFSEYLTANGISQDQIVKITSGRAVLTATASGSGYGFIQDAEIYISLPDSPANNRLIFERLSIPPNT
ncbi:MAG TPA: hypothetical protein ENJ45_04590, partial [Phaeodactylibacter sp.]|nr:hypothetical protein [Phaeodactylibacter sp.]